MEIVIKISQMLLSLSILIVIHELGHFIPAKLFGTRIEKFYLFFNPWFSLFKKKFRGTEYGIGWIPLGGFVKISGMIDESLDKQGADKPESWEFRAKPAWQRFIILIGGVVMNILCAVVIYSGILWYWGERYIPLSEINKYGIATSKVSQQLGLKDGDKIIAVDETQPKSYRELQKEIILGNSMKVLRQEQTLDIPIDAKVKKEILQKSQKTSRPKEIIAPRIPFDIAEVLPNSLAAEIGLQKGDKLVTINGRSVAFLHEYKQLSADLIGKEVSLTVLRNGTHLTKNNVLIPQSGKLGVAIAPSYEYAQQKYSFLESLPRGVSSMIGGLSSYVRQFKLIFDSETEGYKQLGGFISIGKIFPSQWNWQAFWQLTAFISLMLAFMNILPIPALDGGHLVFITYEMITRRKPSIKVLETAQKVGMIILFLLLIFANMNDIIKLF